MELGDLEAEVLGAVSTLRQASARNVLGHLSKDRRIAYTTVSTTLDRLYRKGLLSRERRTGRGGVQFVFSPAKSPRVADKFVTKALDKLVQAFGPSVVPRIYERLEELPAEQLRELGRRVAGAKGK